MAAGTADAFSASLAGLMPKFDLAMPWDAPGSAPPVADSSPPISAQPSAPTAAANSTGGAAGPPAEDVRPGAGDPPVEDAVDGDSAAGGWLSTWLANLGHRAGGAPPTPPPTPSAESPPRPPGSPGGGAAPAPAAAPPLLSWAVRLAEGALGGGEALAAMSPQHGRPRGDVGGSPPSANTGAVPAHEVLAALLDIERRCCPFVQSGTSPAPGEVVDGPELSVRLVLDEPGQRYCVCLPGSSSGVVGVLWARWRGVELESVLRAFCDLEQRRQWDSDSRFEVLRPAAASDPTQEEIWHVAAPSPWPLMDREFLWRQWSLPLPASARYGDGRAIVVRSFEDEALLPEDPNKVRASVQHQGILLRPFGDGKDSGLDLTCCTQISLGGDLPDWLQALLLQFGVQTALGWASSLRDWCTRGAPAPLAVVSVPRFRELAQSIPDGWADSCEAPAEPDGVAATTGGEAARPPPGEPPQQPMARLAEDAALPASWADSADGGGVGGEADPFAQWLASMRALLFAPGAEREAHVAEGVARSPSAGACSPSERGFDLGDRSGPERVLEAIHAVERMCCPFLFQGEGPTPGVLGAIGGDAGSAKGCAGQGPVRLLRDEERVRSCYVQSPDGHLITIVMWVRFEDVSIDDILRALSIEQRGRWDTHSKFEVLRAEEAEGHADGALWYINSPGVWPLKGLDFLWRQWRVPFDAPHGPGVGVVARSVADDALRPEAPGATRVRVNFQGWLLRPTEVTARTGSGCQLTFCTQNDIGKMVPNWARALSIRIALDMQLGWAEDLRKWCLRGSAAEPSAVGAAPGHTVDEARASVPGAEFPACGGAAAGAGGGGGASPKAEELAAGPLSWGPKGDEWDLRSLLVALLPPSPQSPPSHRQHELGRQGSGS